MLRDNASSSCGDTSCDAGQWTIVRRTKFVDGSLDVLDQNEDRVERFFERGERFFERRQEQLERKDPPPPR
jgi:hypothetical protein